MSGKSPKNLFCSVSARESFCQIIQDTGNDHNRWVNTGGLRTGELGPIDSLIREFEECLDLARRLKSAIEEDDD